MAKAPNRFGEFARSARAPLMLGVAFAAGAFFAFSGSGPDLTAGEVADSAGNARVGGGPLSSAFFAEGKLAEGFGTSGSPETHADRSLIRMPMLRTVSTGKDVASGDFSQMPQLQDESSVAGKFGGCAKFDAEAKIKSQNQCAAQDAASVKARFNAECGDKSSKADFNFDREVNSDVGSAGPVAGGGSLPGVRAKLSAGKPGNGQFGNNGGFKSGGCGGKKKVQPQFKQSVKQPLRIPKNKDGNPSA